MFLFSLLLNHTAEQSIFRHLNIKACLPKANAEKLLRIQLHIKNYFLGILIDKNKSHSTQKEQHNFIHRCNIPSVHCYTIYVRTILQSYMLSNWNHLFIEIFCSTNFIRLYNEIKICIIKNYSFLNDIVFLRYYKVVSYIFTKTYW